MSPAILRIFVEPLSNAIDNTSRSKKTRTKCTAIHVTIDKKTGETSVWNDGAVIPIEKNTEHKLYNHSMIFGHLRTGSNYDDDEERDISGRNGYGAKVSNIFSSKFTVEGCDPKKKKILKQTWSENMRQTDGPIIEEMPVGNKGYTKVTWIPDFARFGLKKGYTDDIVAMYTRFVIDAAMLTKVNVTINGKEIPVKSLADYAQQYDDIGDEKRLIKTVNSEVMITPSTSGFQTISFVNGVYTRLGGKHVDSWAETLFRPIVEKFNSRPQNTTKDQKPIKITIADVKQFFRLFVVATVIRPEFDSQDKNFLEHPNVEAEPKPADLNALKKWSVMQRIESVIRAKEMGVLKKVESKKRNVKVEGLDRANNAGGRNSEHCTLIVCEGLSAKTYAVAGIEKGVYGKKGRDWFGILPLTGKILNTRNATPTQVAGNKVVQRLMQSLGIRIGVDYTDDSNYRSLNYGKVLCLTDADTDGIHIEGLLLNLFHSLYPTVLERPNPFIVSMKTPIARVMRPKINDLIFYDERNFTNWLSNQNRKVNVKYYKGLGTTKPEDVPDTFGMKMVEYVNDENTCKSMDKIFHKKFTDARKQWIGNYDPDNYNFSLDKTDEISGMNISDFLDCEMIKFSHDDCARSIPSGVDGLKESQRKILYAVKKRRLTHNSKSLKVAQLGGYTAEHSNYHHGEQNLYETIVGMANEFPGTNNIPLLYRDGMFGTRLAGGDDAASARYIYTKMEAMTETIFREDDEPLLTHVNDDGDFVQPEYYVPIIPMILVNGCQGIGTGWSSNIPNYNPLDLVQSIRTWLDCDGNFILEDPDDGSMVSMLPDLKPWYREHKGDIRKDNDSRYISYGVLQETKTGVVQITELPVGIWTSDFKESLENLEQAKKIKNLKDYSSPKDVHFAFQDNDEFESTIESLKLYSYLNVTNMVLFNEKNQLRKYNDTDEIIDDFCQVRYKFYTLRKKHKIKTLEAEIRYLGNKERFVRDVINEELVIMNVAEKDVIAKLKASGYDEDPKKDTDDNGYDYLLRMQVRTFTKDKIKQLKDDIASKKKEMENLKKTSEKKMWLDELAEFVDAYEKWCKVIASQTVKNVKNSKK